MNPDRPSLVFVHGAGGSSNYWTRQLRDLLDVANTLAMDLPGHGQSPGPGACSVPDYTRSLIDLIEELAPPRPVLVGFSMGGAIAQQALLECQEKFSGAVLIATGSKLGVLPQVFEIVERDFPAYLEMMARATVSPQTPRELVQSVMDDAAGQDPRVILEDFRACDAFDSRERLSEIGVPVLVITAEDDLLAPPKWGHFLAEHIPGANRVHLTGAGHLVSVEKSREVNRAIREFVGTIGT